MSKPGVLTGGMATTPTGGLEVDEVDTQLLDVDRVERWQMPGVLLTADAAHTVSPIGRVGINCSVQYSVVAANVIAKVIAERKPLNQRVPSEVSAVEKSPLSA
ncbi:MAG TPA: FAD-dependent monooxygenase [Spongiibacteraceae bacterium]|nr:FAD-dependent monooxygenase [Spongiibacteraceae bacterium]